MDDELRAKLRGLSFREQIEVIKSEEKRKKQKKEELINEVVEYDDKTLMAFEQYVKDFQLLYPGILTDEEIMNRLKANIKHNIVEADSLEEYSGHEKGGVFLPERHMVAIYSGYSEKLKREVLFHELTHSLVSRNPYDNFNHEYYEDDNFMIESIVTIMEEDFREKIYNEKPRRVNNYIPNYARALRAIFGRDLIESYIKRFKNIENLFAICEGNTGYELSFIGTDVIGEIDSIYYNVKKGIGDSNVEYQSANVELKLAHTMDMYFTNTNLPDVVKLRRIEQLVANELSPNFDVFRNIIEKHIKDKSLIKDYGIANFIYYAPTLSDYERNHTNWDVNTTVSQTSLRETVKKYEDFLAKKMFNINIYEVDEITNLPSYDEESYLEYIENKDLYRGLTYLYEDEDISEEDLNITEVKRAVRVNKPKYGIEDQLDYGESAGVIRLNNAIFSDPSIYKCKTDNREYYVVDSYGDAELLTKTPTLDAIVKYVNDIPEDEDYREVYVKVAERLRFLNNIGITDVFIAKNEYIYEKDGEIYRGSFFLDETGNSKIPVLDETKFEMENVSMLPCKTSSKKR